MPAQSRRETQTGSFFQQENVLCDPSVRLLYCCWDPRISQWEHANLSAPYWRFYWNSKPGGSVVLNGKRHSLLPANFYLIPPNTPYSSHLEHPVGHLYLHFLLRTPHQTKASAIFCIDAPSPMRITAGSLCKLLQAKPAPDWHAGMTAMCLIHYALCRLPAETFGLPVADARIAAVLEMIAREPARRRTNAELARTACMATNSFIRLFHKAAGTPPQVYLRLQRVEQACVLLEHSPAGIKEIAEAAGFCDRYHFSRVFRQVRGLGPAQYRRGSIVNRGGNPTPAPAPTGNFSKRRL